MKRLKKLFILVIVLLVLWAVINPFLFQFTTADDDAKTAFTRAGMKISLGDFKYKKNNLHFARIGDTSKTVLLFIHGSPGCWDFAWDYFMDSSWQKNFEMVSIDRPGFGQSDYGVAKNLFEQSEIISAFIKSTLAGRKIQLVGHSYGGPLVLQLCADNDLLFDKCIIMAGSISPQAEKEEVQLEMFSHPLFKWMVPGSFEQGVEELLWLKDDLKNKKYLDVVAKIKTPIVAIYGTEDNMVPYKPNVDFLIQNFATAQFKIYPLEGANHFLPWKNYADVKKIISGNADTEQPK